MRMRVYNRFCGALLACLCTLLLRPPVSYADGGAPNRAYIAGTTRGIGVIDIAQQQVLGGLAAQGNPDEVLLSLDGRFLYVTQPQLGDLVVLSTATGSTICKAALPGQPSLLTLDSTSNTLYVAGNGAAAVRAIDPENCHTKRTLQTDGPVYGLAIAANGTTTTGSNGDQVWISTNTGLTLFQESDGRAIGTITLANDPRYLSIPPGSVVYVTTQQGSVVAVGLAKHDVTPLMTGGQYGPMDFDEQTGEIFVPDHLHNQLDVLTPISPGFPAPKEPERVVKLPSAPNSIAITSDGQFGFAALQGGSVAMLDIPGRQLVKVFHVGGNPRFIITGLNPPVIGTTPQQANLIGWLLPLSAYIVIGGLFIVPLLLLRKRFTRALGTKQQEQG